MTHMPRTKAPCSELDFWRDSRGLSTVEYVIILVLIASAAVGTWQIFGQTIRGKVKAAAVEMQKVQVK